MRQLLPLDNYFVDTRVPKLQHVPILVEDDGTYPFEANAYLVERSCGEWSPNPDERSDPVVPTLKSRKDIAARLIAFFRWCAVEQISWRDMGYTEHLLDRYQVQLLTGSASASGKKLADNTVNLYVDEAATFLLWAADRGFRSPFKISKRRLRGHKQSTTLMLQRIPQSDLTVRQGRLQSEEAELVLPDSSQIERWLRAVQHRHPIKALQFELMCRTGARISESNQLSTTCVPRQDSWSESWTKRGKIPVKLQYGVKGKKISPASLRSTRTRTIEIPLDLCERIEHYSTFVRPVLQSRQIRRDGRGAQSNRLWLGEHKWLPVSNQMLYKAWTEGPYCPPGWHPHLSRHYFAVETICATASQLFELHRIENPNGVPIGWLHGLMAGQVRLILSPLLGHVDESTTMRYLKYAHHRMIEEFGHPALRWNSIIDEDLSGSSP